MLRRSTNNPWFPPKGLNSGSFSIIGGDSGDPGDTVGRFPGLLGQTVVHSNATALKDSDTSVGTLYMGVYQIVKFSSAITRGELVFWDTLANNGLSTFTVTHTSTAAANFRAGVALYTDASASGKYGYIQVAGLANMLYGNSAVGTIGLAVIQATALDTPLLTVATVNTSADATTVLVEDQRAFVGVAYETPSQAAVKRVLMNLAGFYPNIA